MYALAQRLDPESIYQISRLAYAELAMSGITAVGEFHYIHHQAHGTPYDNRTELAEAVIHAATEVGMRISLLRVIYQRGSATSEPSPTQQRFCDASIDDALGDIDSLQSRFANHPSVTVGVAIHSVRAVSRPWIQRASEYAKSHGLPLHMHLSEQRRELEECTAEYGLAPVALMAADGILDENFVAVHATHLEDDEVVALGKANSFVCLCRTTERDLGDGLCDATGLVNAGARICTGVDSHAVSDPFQEARAIELDERSRTEARTVVANGTQLLCAASQTGYAAIGFAGREEEDLVTLTTTDPALVGFSEDKLDDAVIFSGCARSIDTVVVNGKIIVKSGQHEQYEDIRRDFLSCMEQSGPM